MRRDPWTKVDQKPNRGLTEPIGGHGSVLMVASSKGVVMSHRTEIVYYADARYGELKVQNRLNEKAHCSVSFTWNLPQSPSLYLRIGDDLPSGWIERRKPSPV